MTVKNLQFVRGILSYKGFIITGVNGIGEECYGQYIWSEWEASQLGCSETIVEESLEELLKSIDVKLGEV